jgi:hypothetical protein
MRVSGAIWLAVAVPIATLIAVGAAFGRKVVLRDSTLVPSAISGSPTIVFRRDMASAGER